MKYLRFLLFPFSIGYNVITSFRNYLYDTHLWATHSFQMPILVVGNLSVGGTGKTPQVEYLVRLLKEDYKLAILSRGYKRKTKGFLLLNQRSLVNEVGDESLQYFRKFPQISVAVDENRVSGVEKLIASENPDVIILDDAFQHRKIKGSLYFMLTDYNKLFTKDFLLPAGNLRESRSGALRADVIIVSKCPVDFSMEEQQKIKTKLQKYQRHVFFTTIQYDNETQGTHAIPLTELKNYPVLLITGIARPKPLLEFLENNEIKYKHMEFADHHHFSSKDIEKIKQEKTKLGRETILLTTEKDYTRLKDKIDISYLGIRVEFLNNEGIIFDKRVRKHVDNHIA